jgi:AcrR family transcriptional regulator
VTLDTALSKPPRADARRNRDAVLTAAKDVFARMGTDAPLDIVTRAAGVGRGTLYRHFPTREHLVAAIMADRAGALAAKARELLAAPDMLAAIMEWLRLYDRSAAEYPGMSAHVGGGLADGSSPVTPACGEMTGDFAALLRCAQGEGRVRGDITAVQLLSLIGSLPKDPDTGRTAGPYLEVVFDGLAVQYP